MGFLTGSLGATMGAIIGLIITNLIGAEISGGQDFDWAFFMVQFGLPALILGAVFGIVLALLIRRSLRRDPMTPHHRRTRTIVLISIGIGVFGLSWGMMQMAASKMSPTSDQMFMNAFPRHEVPLNRIVQMAQRDTILVSIGPGFTNYSTSAKTKLPPSRVAEYRQLLQQAHVLNGFLVMRSPFEADFDYYENGSAISSDLNEGYAYLEKPPARHVNDLNDYQFNEEDYDQKVYRPIVGNWYLFREYLPG